MLYHLAKHLVSASLVSFGLLASNWHVLLAEFPNDKAVEKGSLK
jgi:hypothetical protein